MTAGLQFLVAGVGTYLLRVSAIALVGRGGGIPPKVGHAIRLIPPAVLAAIVADSLILHGGYLNSRPSWYAGALVAAVVVRRSGSAAWAMATAMAVVWLLQGIGLS